MDSGCNLKEIIVYNRPFVSKAARFKDDGMLFLLSKPFFCFLMENHKENRLRFESNPSCSACDD